ncbi:MAG: cadherin domain-containing protein [Chloroflexi bacterium]|nr:cadherin domain-containing protein [Chloroflexota bacterium]
MPISLGPSIYVARVDVGKLPGLMGPRLPSGVLCFLIVGALIATLLATAPGASAQTDVPDAPTDVAVYTYKSQQLEVRWSSTDADSTASFKVQWKSGSEEYDSTRQVTSDPTASVVSLLSTSAKSRYKEVITGLTNDTEYTVRVIAVNSSGDSVPSVEETGTPKSGLPPARPFIEKEIIELFESSHPWLRETWDFMLNQNVAAEFSTQDGGYAWIDHCSLIVAQLRRCVAREIGAGRYYSGLEYVIVHELAHIYTLANSITSSPGPLGAAHLYFYDLVPFSYGLQHFSESEYFSCKPIELYADALSIVTLGTEDVSAGSYWRSCDYITETVSAEAITVVSSAARGDMPSWLADTYENADGNLDLDRIWAEVKAIEDTKDRAVVVYHLRNSFGGYCNNRKADASAFGNGVTRNPWSDGGCQPLEPTNVTVTSTGNGTLTVSWREPSYDGGSPVEGYKVQWKSGVQEYSRSRSATVTDLADLQHTISGLASGQSHTLRVLAYNHNGDGDAAEATATPTATDTAAPTLLTARIDREDSSLRLTYSERLDETSVPASGAFALNIGGGSRTVTAGVAANVVTLSLSGTLNATDTANVTYTAPTGPAARPLKDFAGNEAAGFSSRTVRNDATDVAIISDPGADKTYSWNRGGSWRDVIQATVTFNEPVSVSGVPRLRLKIGEETRAATYASGTGTSTLTFRYPLTEGDVDNDGISVQQSAIQGMVRYVSTGEEAPARVKLDPQAGHLVDAMPPSLVSAAILEGHTDLVLTWDDTLDESFVPPASSSGFYVFDKIARERVHNDAVAVQGNQVTVTLASAVTADDDLIVSYRDFVSTGLRDTVGNYAKKASAKQVKIVQPNRVPAFPSTEDGMRGVDENTPPGRDIGAPIAATDADGDSLTYAISGTDAASFDVVDTSGQLRTKEALNYEGKSSYTLTMSVTDGKDLHGNTDTTVDDTITVMVTVSDSNEPPEVTGQASHSVDENVEDFSQTYTASDPEGTASTFTWSLSGADSGDFDIDRNTGELTFKNPPNFESPADSNRDNEYLVTVQATEEGNLRGELAVTVTVNDVNEAPAISGDAALSYAENTATTRTLDRYSATDPEGSSLTWAVGGTDSGDFNIDSSGNLTFAEIPDHENPTDSGGNNVYNVQIVATDDGNLGDGTSSGQGSQSTSFDVTVTVTPVNEPPTVSGPASHSVNENVEDFSQTYTASDPEGAASTFTWSLAGTDGGDFNIDRDTGELTFRSTPNYESPADSNRDNEYLVTVRAYDGQYYGTLPITVEVLNVNEPPALRQVSNPQFSRRENATGAIYQFSATDPEGHGINWSTAGPDAGEFTITGGTLEFATPPDYENPGDAGRDNVYNVTVRATDDVPNQPLTDELPVTVTVTAVNEGPEISRVGNLFGTPPGSVPENLAQDTVLARYTATDPEGGMVSRWRTSGTDGGDFVINEQGELRFRNSPDYERPADSNRDNEYTFTVQVSDGSIYASFDETVTVTPVNEPPAITTTSTSATSLRQPENRTSRLYTYRATDPEGSSTITWSLGRDDRRFFTINERGEFSFREDRSPDFDIPGDSGSDNIYEVTIQVSDDSSPPNTESLAVTVTVTDVNEGPEVTRGGNSFNVQENQEWAGATFTARDPESGDVTRWSLGGRDGGDFTIDASGVMTFRRTPDHERPDDWNRDNEYEVEVRPYDGRYYGSHQVTVTVGDVNEISGNATITRAESQEGVLATYTAGGRGDLAVNPAWRLTGTDGGDFTIDENGQLAFRNTPDHERPADSNRDNEYVFTVQASDDRYYDTFDVTVTVTPVNEPPTITTTSRTEFTQPENRITRLYTYRATDPEGSSTTRWSLGGVDGRFFAINQRGEFSFAAASPPDFERPGDSGGDNVYQVTIQVSDDSSPPNTESLPVTVTVTDVNEGPEITSGGRRFTVRENQEWAGETFTASDPEGGSVSRWTLGGRDGGDFSIDENGVLTFRNIPDYERPADSDQNNIYEVEVRPYDGRYYGSHHVTVTVTPVNEAPEITTTSSSATTMRHPENRTSRLYAYRATDPENRAVTWSVAGTHARFFRIDEQRGELYFDEDNGPDYENPRGSGTGGHEYQVTIQASDDSSPPNTANLPVTVTVTDVNEGPEVTSGGESFTVQENQDLTNASFSASDPEGGTVSRWSLGGRDGGDFTITETGVMTFRNTPDYERPADSDRNNIYEVEVRPYDGRYYGSHHVTVTVTPVNEAPEITTTSSSATTMRHPENRTSRLYAYRATDPEREAIRWSVAGTHARFFRIDEERGELYFSETTPPDYENPQGSGIGSQEYQVTTRASDGTLTGTHEVTVTVTDVNEGPEVTSGGDSFTVQENSNWAGASFGANDPEGETISRWSLGGRDGGDFTITETGVMTFRSVPDFERPADSDRNNIYEVEVRPYDGRYYGSHAVTVTVGDVSEISGTPAITRPENFEGTLATYTAGGTGDLVVEPAWRLTGTDSGDFTIDESGALAFRNIPDHERPADSNRDNVYLFTVQATDDRYYGTLDVTATVAPVNELPIITTASESAAKMRHPENRTSRLYTYRATDLEGGAISWSVAGTHARFFTIDEQRGELYFSESTPPDYESPQGSGAEGHEYQVTVRASDDDSNVAGFDVTVTITDVNEGPEVTSGGDSFTVQENRSWGGASFGASDPEGETVSRWSLGGRDGGDFTITETGVMTFRSVPDYERPDDSDRDNVYEVEVRPYDGRYYGSHAVTVTVSDVTEVTGNAAITRAEGQDGVLATYTAGGRGDLIVEPAWRLTGTDSGDFTIDENGALAFRNTPDHERPADSNRDNEYLFTVQASDDRYYGTLGVMVTVTPVNEAPVITTKSRTEFTQRENTASVLYTYRATDPDPDDTITWSVEGADGADFAIYNGVLTFRLLPDYELPADSDGDNVYEITVVADDQGGLRDRVDATVTVTEVNEGPKVTGTTAFTVVEGGNLSGASFTANDQEGDEVTRWSLSGSDGGDFQISETGVMTFRILPDYDRPADSNRDNEYLVSVRAYDSGNRYGSLDVRVTVTDVNEEVPVVTGRETLSFQENTATTTRLYTYRATDTDLNTVFTWSVEGDDGGDFTITPDSGGRGELFFRSPPDHEQPADQDTDNVYDITIVASDGTNRGELPVAVTVTEVNEGPTITGTTQFTVSERQSVTQSVDVAGATFTAADPEGDDVTRWSLTGTDGGDFTITDTSDQTGNDTADLTFRNPPDVDRPADGNRDNEYLVTIRAYDSRGRYGSYDITVTVTGANEPPVITGSNARTFSENGTGTVYTYRATDPEGDEFDWITPGGTDGSLFEVSERGVLTFRDPPDFDDPADANDDNAYELTVRARDDQGNTGTFDVTVTVTDLNEGPVVTGRESISLQEYTDPTLDPQTQTLATYSAVDPEGSDITRWSLSGSDGGDFLISEDGELTFRNAPDYDRPADGNRDNEYLVSVRAYDATNRYGSLEVTVTVGSENEAAPVVTGSQSLSFRENTPITQRLYTYRATDTDRNTTITWSVRGQGGRDDGDAFDISDTGVLTFSSPPDYESPTDSDTGNEYLISVVATDDQGSEGTLDVSITVTEVNEGPEPTGTTAYTVVEGQSLANATFTARDPDAGERDDAVTGWRLAGTDAGDFNIGPTGTYTAQLTFRNTPDFDRPADGNRDNEYLVTIRAYNGSTYGELEVTVTVRDENEAAPEITGRDTLSFRENTATDVRLYTYTARDMDLNTKIQWSVRGTDGGDFTITPDSSGRGQLFFSSAPNHEQPADADQDNVYDITVVASDGSNEGTLDVTVTVTEVNEGPEVTGQAARSVAENFDQVVATYTAVDPEGSEVTRWSLGGTDSGDFTITDTSEQTGRATADLTFRNPPDHDRPADGNRDNEYLVTIRPYDGRVYGSYEVTITVASDNEPPVITGSNARTFRENGTGTIYTYRATDPEGNDFTWSVGGLDASRFEISERGVLSFINPPDFENPPRPDDNDYQVTVQATDAQGSVGTFDVVVSVTNQDEGPEIAETSSNTAIDVQENHEAVLATYTATDPEDTTTEITRWSVSGRDGGDFTINEGGELTFRNNPDHERPADSDRDNVYEVMVRASDGRYYGNLDVIVTVNAVNEAPEFRSNSTTVFTYQENDTRDLYTYRATDPEGGDITWRLSGDDSSAFAISETGVLTFASPPDYESPSDSGRNNIYLVTVEARDADDSTAQIAKLEVTVTVTNLTD